MKKQAHLWTPRGGGRGGPRQGYGGWFDQPQPDNQRERSPAGALLPCYNPSGEGWPRDSHLLRGVGLHRPKEADMDPLGPWHLCVYLHCRVLGFAP
jgi:hypothetical protein